MQEKLIYLLLWFGWSLSASSEGSCVRGLVPKIAALSGGETFKRQVYCRIKRPLRCCPLKGLMLVLQSELVPTEWAIVKEQKWFLSAASCLIMWQFLHSCIVRPSARRTSWKRSRSWHHALELPWFFFVKCLQFKGLLNCMCICVCLHILLACPQKRVSYFLELSCCEPTNMDVENWT